MSIKNVCVIGSGVMGCNIAAHLSNAGLNVLLIDQPNVNGEKNLNIKKNIDTFSKIKPNIFFAQNLKNKIKIGNLEDNLNDIVAYDWVIEAIIENVDIKNGLFLKIDNILKNSKNKTIVTSNTSGLSVRQMCKGTSLDFRKNFLVTHFFNPVRYLYLLEIIPSEDTIPENIKLLSDFCYRVLGKGVIHAKESPNFIANRIGIYATLKIMKIMMQEKYTIEEVDYILGEQTGRPKSAVFKTLDIVGLDTFAHVTDNCFNTLHADEEHGVFKKPEFLNKMIEMKLMGRKTKKGFYKKSGNSIDVLDINSMQYFPKKKIKYPSIEEAKKHTSIVDKVKCILDKNDRASKLLRDITVFACIYAANRVFEISNDIESIDNSMKWGFNWNKGPFEICDIMGIKEFVKLANQSSSKIPSWLSNDNLLKHNCFYKFENVIKKVWSPLKE